MKNNNNWLNAVAEDNNEFLHLATIPYTAENVWRLLVSERFLPADYANQIIVPRDTNPQFPDALRDRRMQRWHPSTKIRLLSALRRDFLDFLMEKFEREGATPGTG